jgi:hypothetical protein
MKMGRRSWNTLWKCNGIDFFLRVLLDIDHDPTEGVGWVMHFYFQFVGLLVRIFSQELEHWNVSGRWMHAYEKGVCILELIIICYFILFCFIMFIFGGLFI